LWRPQRLCPDLSHHHCKTWAECEPDTPSKSPCLRAAVVRSGWHFRSRIYTGSTAHSQCQETTAWRDCRMLRWWLVNMVQVAAGAAGAAVVLLLVLRLTPLGHTARRWFTSMPLGLHNSRRAKKKHAVIDLAQFDTVKSYIASLPRSPRRSLTKARELDPSIRLQVVRAPTAPTTMPSPLGPQDLEIVHS
jgi:hypothetical protein